MGVARRLNAGAGAPRLPPLLALTDPARTPDPLALAAALPPGSGLVYRHFGADDRRSVARRLAALCRRRGLVFLIGADIALAHAVGADGVHLPERLVYRGRTGLPGLIATGAAHGRAGLRRAAEAGLDAALLSPVFASASASAGAPLGAQRAGRMARAAGLPVYALGGVSRANARSLLGLGFAGIAGVSLD